MRLFPFSLFSDLQSLLFHFFLLFSDLHRVYRLILVMGLSPLFGDLHRVYGKIKVMFHSPFYYSLVFIIRGDMVTGPVCMGEHVCNAGLVDTLRATLFARLITYFTCSFVTKRGRTYGFWSERSMSLWDFIENL